MNEGFEKVKVGVELIQALDNPFAVIYNYPNR